MHSYLFIYIFLFFFFSSRRRHTRSKRDWSSDVCSSDLPAQQKIAVITWPPRRVYQDSRDQITTEDKEKVDAHPSGLHEICREQRDVRRRQVKHQHPQNGDAAQSVEFRDPAAARMRNGGGG